MSVVHCRSFRKKCKGGMLFAVSDAAFYFNMTAALFARLCCFDRMAYSGAWRGFSAQHGLPFCQIDCRETVSRKV